MSTISTESSARLLNEVRRIAQDIAAVQADDVDASSRFPKAAIDALGQAGALSAAVPRPCQGPGWGLTDLGTMCTILGRACAATSMIVAMHHIQVASIARHCAPESALGRYLAQLVAKPRLIASVTSEVGPSGDLRRSVAAVETQGETYRLDKHATTISYGQQTDDLLITARRSPDAADSDQVLVLACRGEFRLDDVGTWNTLGMRGTCSPGARVHVEAPVDHIVPEPFADIASMTMVPYSHILWASCWLGIAEDAVARARASVRARARKQPQDVPGLALLSDLAARLDTMRDAIRFAAAEVDAAGSPDDASRRQDPAGIRHRAAALTFALRMNNLKLSASQMLVNIVTDAMQICGIAGYKNSGPTSLGRHLRDAHSAPLMISNLRIHQANGAILTIAKGTDA